MTTSTKTAAKTTSANKTAETKTNVETKQPVAKTTAVKAPAKTTAAKTAETKQPVAKTTEQKVVETKQPEQNVQTNVENENENSEKQAVTVTIEKGQLYGKPFSGTYELVNTSFERKVRPHNAHRGDGKVVIIDENGEQKAVWVFKNDIKINGEYVAPYARFKRENPIHSAPLHAPETVEEMKERITKRFNVMNLMTKGLIQGSIRSLIISGAPGIGKTYTLDKELQRANDAGEIEYTSINGKISGIGLYARLWETREKGSILLLDDVDVFSSEDVLNLLKAALDSGEKRKVCWSTASSYLEEKEIPKEFDYEGTIVFITNTDVDREVKRGTKIAPHLDALVSRSVYLDLGVHSNSEIMVRVEEVIRNTTMLQNVGLNADDTLEVLEWMKENVKRLRNVSLRTALYIASFILTDRENWKEIAEVTQFV